MNTGYCLRAKWLGILLTICAVALFSACQGGSGVSSPGVSPPVTGEDVSLDQMLADLNGLSAPPDVDTLLFDEMKQSLATALNSLGQQRFVSLAPYTDLSAVTDFAIQANGDNSGSLTWTYQSQGDYDQNSEVNVADLTPIVINYGANSAEANWANGSVADGDGNGEVNLSDITPIATNYTRTVAGYYIYTTPTPLIEESWVKLDDEVLFSEGVIPDGLSRRAFEYNLLDPVGSNYYRVAPFHTGDVGTISNFDKFAALALPGAPGNLTATKGTLVDEVYLTWELMVDVQMYMVERRIGQVGNFEEVSFALPGESEYSNKTVVSGEIYQYRVKGVKGDRESAYSGIAEGWPMRLPTIPQNLDASDGTSATSVELSWDEVGEIDEYVVYRSTESGTGHVEIGRTTEITYSDTDATTEFMYFYQVTAANAVGESGASNENDGWLEGYVFPPVADSVDPVSGTEGSNQTFNVTTSGGAVDSYSWDFGGGATPDTPTDASPSVTLGALGTYNASVTVANVTGEDTFAFELTVGANAWVHTWGTDKDDVTQGFGVDDAGNVYVVGRPGTINDNAPDLNIVKFDPFGGVVWAKNITPQEQPWTYTAEVDGAGNIYIAGGFSWNSGLAMIKLNSDGQIEWQRYLDIDPLNRPHITVDDAGMVYFCVDSENIGGSGFNFLLLKFNPSGDLQWQNFIKNNGKVGGADDDYSMTAITSDNANNLYILAAEGKILKLDSNGNGIWQKAWTTGLHDHPYDIHIDDEQNLYLAGGSGDTGDYRSFVLKMDSTGGVLFQTGFELVGPGLGSSGFDDIIVDGDNNLWGMISSVHFSGPPDEAISHLLSLNQTGEITGHWSYENPGSKPSLWDFKISPNGGFYFAGYDDNNLGTWETANHTLNGFDGDISDEPYEIVPSFLTPQESMITSSDATGTLDTGGGGSDMLAIKLDPASLP